MSVLYLWINYIINITDRLALLAHSVGMKPNF
jgi:hypothetical protein